MTDSIIKDYFAEDGELKKSLPCFEYRHEQLVMAEHVYKTFLERGILLAEAQTGTGKTLAYLIPAVLSGKKTVISTGTKNLQEQIFKKDIPFLKERLGLKFNAACMKGRSNYICLKRYKNFSKQGIFEFQRDVKDFMKVEKWLNDTETGDIEELTGIRESAPFFKFITSSSEQCSGQKCPNVKECFITKMREKSLKADIIIINHHLFFADLVVKEHSEQFVVVPRYQALVFDEAHQLEDTASSYFGVVISNYRVEELARDIQFTMSTEKIADDKLITLLDRFLANANIFFAIFSRFSKSDEASFKLSTLLKYKEDEAVKALSELYGSFDVLIAHIDIMKDKSEEMLNCFRRVVGMKDELNFVMSMSDENYVYWCESRRKGVFLKANQIDVSATLRASLFDKQDTIVMTSATLATDTGFTFIKDRLGLGARIDSNPEREGGEIIGGTHESVNDSDSLSKRDNKKLKVDELTLDSPFDFETRAMYYLPIIKNEPSEKGFVEETSARMLELVRVCEGRTFLLFTSVKNMRAVYELIADDITQSTFMQGDMPRSALLREFIEDESSVLFATMSFWGGVDVQGEPLICVVIDKLPFSSPGEPLVEAKINLIKSRGGNPFFEFQVPQAIITLKQGLGRLIRKKDDYGILSILDRRLRSKSYGKRFVKSIPKSNISRDIKDVETFLKRF